MQAVDNSLMGEMWIADCGWASTTGKSGKQHYVYYTCGTCGSFASGSVSDKLWDEVLEKGDAEVDKKVKSCLSTEHGGHLASAMHVLRSQSYMVPLSSVVGMVGHGRGARHMTFANHGNSFGAMVDGKWWTASTTRGAPLPVK